LGSDPLRRRQLLKGFLQRVKTIARLEFQKSRQLFIRVHNETLPVIAMRHCHTATAWLSPFPQSHCQSRWCSLLIKLNTALFAPIANAAVITAMAVNLGLFSNPRSATLMLVNICLIRNEALLLDLTRPHDVPAARSRRVRPWQATSALR
jgi:hypothetical protein